MSAVDVVNGQPSGWLYAANADQIVHAMTAAVAGAGRLQLKASRSTQTR